MVTAMAPKNHDGHQQRGATGDRMELRRQAGAGSARSPLGAGSTAGRWDSRAPAATLKAQFGRDRSDAATPQP